MRIVADVKTLSKSLLHLCSFFITEGAARCFAAVFRRDKGRSLGGGSRIYTKTGNRCDGGRRGKGASP